MHPDIQALEDQFEAVARDYATVGYPDAQQAAQRLLKARYTWGFSTGSQA